MNAYVWEPHHRTGGGALVRSFEIEPGRTPPHTFLIVDARHADQTLRGGRARKRRARIDRRVRTVRLEALIFGWQLSPLDEPIRAVVYALPDEHRAHRGAMREQLLDLWARPAARRGCDCGAAAGEIHAFDCSVRG